MISYARLTKFHERFVPAGETEIQKQVAEYRTATPYHLANILIRRKFKAIKELYELLTNLIGADAVKQLPLLVPIKGAYGQCAVYPNLTGIDYSAIQIHKGPEVLSGVSAMTISKGIKLKFDEDMKDEKAKIKYADFMRTKKYIYRKDVMTWGRILTRYTDLAKKKGENHIALMATHIENDLRPMQLQWATDVDGFRTMYSSGPTSCMSLHTHKFEVLEDAGLCPTAFYAFVPGVKGAYITRNGKVCARAVCYDMNKGEGKPKWRYGRIYSDASSFEKKFVALLEEAGIKNMSGTYEIDMEFDIPGFFSKKAKDYLAPAVYFDNAVISKGLTVQFDISSKTFKFLKERGEYNWTYGDSYCLRAKKYVKASCKCCGLGLGDKQQSTPEGAVCSATCAIALGYVEVSFENGDIKWEKPSDDFILITFPHKRYYENEKAILLFIGYGAIPSIHGGWLYRTPKTKTILIDGVVKGCPAIPTNFEVKQVRGKDYEYEFVGYKQVTEAVIDW